MWPCVANLALSILILIQSLGIAMSTKASLYNDFAARVRILKTKDSSESIIFSDEFIGEIFDQTIQIKCEWDNEPKNVCSFLFASIDRRDVINWFTSSKPVQDHKLCILCFDSIYLFEDDTSLKYPVLSIPLLHITVQLDDSKANSFHLLSKCKCLHSGFPVVSFSETVEYAVDYIDRLNIEFSDIHTLRDWYRQLEHRIWECSLFSF
jgi:hypothetical protein